MDQVEKVKTECNTIIEEMNRVQTLMQKGDYINVVTCFNESIKINTSLTANLNELKMDAGKILLKSISNDANNDVNNHGHIQQHYR
jgi:hypothetical protein